MADPQNIKLQQSQLQEVETQLASVEQRMQRLAILKKSIELQLIDPKDSQRFDLFIKQLAKVDTSNIESLRGYISGANDKFDELINKNQEFSSQSEQTLKIYNKADKQFAGIASRLDRATASSKKLNSSLEETDELIGSFFEGFEAGLDDWMKLDKIQSAIQDGMDNMSQTQKDQIKNAFGLNSNYDQIASNILEIGKSLENSGTAASNMFQFDLGQIDSMVDTINDSLSNIGQGSFEFNGQEISEELRASFLEGLAKGGDVLAKNMADRIDAVKEVIQQKSRETQEVIDAMIADLTAKSIDPSATILSPEMQGQVEAAWNRIQQAGNAALMDMIVNTSKSSVQLNQFNEKLRETEEAAKAVDGIAKKFSVLGRASESALDSMQYATRNVMPTWLYQTLGLDEAFQNIGDTAKQGLADAAKQIAQGASYTEALSGFAGSFSSSLLKSVGVIGLIVIGVTSLWNMMKGAGEEVKKLSTEFGVSRAAAHGMYKDILNITAAVGNTSLRQEDVLEVLKKHKDTYGVIMDLNNKAGQEAVKFAGELGKQYGVGAGEAYGFTQQLQQLGADEAASQEIAAVAAHASNLAGIPFNNVIKDLAESSEFVATQFAGYPLKAVAAATKIKAMGMSLKSVEKAMNKAFDTKNFMQGMTELSIMTGGVVDLSEMFRKTMAGDVEGAATEIAAQFDKMVASGQMNQFQMRQFAEVTGQSTDELLRGNKMRQHSAELGEENVKLLGKYLDKLSDADVADAKSAMAAAKKLGAAEKLDTIWASIKDTLTQALLPVLEGISTIISGLAPALKLAGAVIKGIVAPFTLIFELVSSIFNLFTFRTKEAGDNIKSFGDIFMSTVGNWSSPLNAIGSILALIVGLWTGSKLIGSIGKIGTMIKGMSTSTLGMFNSLKGMVTGPLSKVSSIASSVMAPGGMMSGMLPGGGMMSGMMGKAGSAASNIMGKASSAASNIAGKVGGAGNLMKIGGGAVAGITGGVSAYKKQKEKGGTDSEAAGAAMIQGGLAASGAVLGTALGGPLGGMVGGFLGDTVGGWLVDNAPGLVKKAGEMWDKLSAKFAKLAETWQPIIEKVFGIISSIIEKAADIWSAVFSKIGDAISWVIDGLDSFANMLGFDGLAGMLGDVLLYPLNLILTGLGNLVDMFTMFGQLLSGDFSGAWDTFTGIITNTIDAVFGLIPGFDGLATMLGDVLMYPINIVMAAFENLVDMFTMVGQLLTGDFTGAWDSFTGMISNSLDALIPDWIWSSDDSKESEKNPEDAAMLKESIAQTNKLDALHKASNTTIDELAKANELTKASNAALKGLSDDEKKRLKDAGYSDDIIKKLDEGNLSIEGAIKENLGNSNLSDSQISELANPNSDPRQLDAIVASSVMDQSSVAVPSLQMGTDLVESDGMALLHKGEAVVPAEVAAGGFGMSPANMPIPLPVKIVGGESIPEPNENSNTPLGFLEKLAPGYAAAIKAKKGFNIPNDLNAVNATVSPVSNEIATVSDVAQKNDMYQTNMNASQTSTSRPSTNQDAMLKQLLTVMQDVANRPVQVQIGGVELKSLNSKMKVYNNK